VKNSKWLLVAGLAIMLMTIACQDQMGSVVPKGDDVNTAGTTLGRRYNNAGSWFLFWYATPTTTPDVHLMSIGQDDGQNGSVTVWKDAANLYVEFKVNAPYWLYETHADVAADSAGLKHNKAGNLNPGQFRYQGPNPITPPTRDNTITIPLSGLPATTPWAMAALCKVFYVNANGDTVWNTGCGSDTTPDNPFKTFRLPDYCVTVAGSKINYPRSYWDITLSGVGGPEAGYNVWDGHWYGWCAELAVSWPGEGTPFEARLWNSLDPNLPADLQNPAWDNISWLINEYAGDSPFYLGYIGGYSQGYFVYDMTQVIWYLMGDQPKPNWEPAQTMATRAETEGQGYIPHHGDYVAVICDPCDPEYVTQLVFIEVDP